MVIGGVLGGMVMRQAQRKGDVDLFMCHLFPPSTMTTTCGLNRSQETVLTSPV